MGRAVLTGWAGLAAGFGVGYLVTRRQPGITPLVVVSAAVATMELTVVAALLSRSGGHPQAGGATRAHPASLPGGFGWCWNRPARSLSSSAGIDLVSSTRRRPIISWRIALISAMRALRSAGSVHHRQDETATGLPRNRRLGARSPRTAPITQCDAAYRHSPISTPTPSDAIAPWQAGSPRVGRSRSQRAGLAGVALLLGVTVGLLGLSASASGSAASALAVKPNRRRRRRLPPRGRS